MIKIILILLSFLPTITLAKNLHVVTEDVPPLQMQKNNNAPTGAMVEIVAAMLARAQLIADIKLYPWARSYQLALSEEDTIIFSLLRDKAREDKFQWIGKLYTLNSYIATLKARDDIEIDNIVKAKAYRVGTIRGDLAENYLLAQGFSMNKNLFLSSKYQILWELLYSERIEAAFTNEILWQYEIESIGLDPKQVQLNYQIPNFANDLYIAASLKTDKAIVVSLTKALKAMKDDGSYQAILTKWQM
jgi:polar amino acid transport system substrate-binding protein